MYKFYPFSINDFRLMTIVCSEQQYTWFFHWPVCVGGFTRFKATYSRLMTWRIQTALEGAMYDCVTIAVQSEMSVKFISNVKRVLGAIGVYVVCEDFL